MRSKSYLFLILIIFSCIVACEKVDIQYGTQVLDNQYTQIVTSDTFTANLSTVYLDSFATSATGVTLLGGFSDPTFGRINTQCFFDLNPPPYANVYDSTIFDSLRLILKINRNYYGDTTKPLHIGVSRLSQQILFPLNVYSFYNVDQFPVSDSIGAGDFIINPTFLTDTLSIPLSASLGQELLSKLKNPLDLDLQNNNNFLYYFNGLRLSSNAGTNLIIGCKDSAIMRLSFSKPGPDSLENHHIDFTLNSKQHHFNHISVNRTGTILSTLGHTDSIIPSGRSNNAAYSQFASGVMAKITFPTLANLLKIPYYAKIMTAYLKVIPVRGSYNTSYFLPPSLNLATTTINNDIGPSLIGIGSASAQTGNLVTDYTAGDNTAYTYDVSNYIKALIQNPQANGYAITNPPAYNYGLLLVPPSPASVTEFSRVIIGDQNQPQNFRTVLEITYLTVQPQ